MTADSLGEKLRKALLGEEGSEVASLGRSTGNNLSTLLRIDALEVDLQLPEGFFRRLLHDSDWSFVIKLHALFEAALTHMLAKHLGQELFEVISHLDMSNSKVGKVAFAAAAGLIEPGAKKYLLKLSEIRNDFVHDVSKTRVTLSEHFAQLDAEKRRGYRKCLTLGFKEEKTERRKPAADTYVAKDILRIATAIAFDDDPKFCLWVGAAYCLASISHSALALDIGHQLRESEGKMLQLLQAWHSTHERGGGHEVA